MLECTGGIGQIAMTHGFRQIKLQRQMSLTSQAEVYMLILDQKPNRATRLWFCARLVPHQYLQIKGLEVNVNGCRTQKGVFQMACRLQEVQRVDEPC